MPDSKIIQYGKYISLQNWSEIYQESRVNLKVQAFHNILRDGYDKLFPEKTVSFTPHDKKWFTPSLKLIHRKMKREYFKHGKSQIYIKLRSKFRRDKRKSIQNNYTNLLSDLKSSNPGQWYKIAKQIGGHSNQLDSNDIEIESLKGLSDTNAAEKIADFFAHTSNEYLPLNLSDLPPFLPALPPPQVEEIEVFEKLSRLKKTRSTYPIDIPSKLRKEGFPFLVAPLTDIFNECLRSQVYPSLWKLEMITPIPKTSCPEKLSELRKIAGTSDYSKLFEGFLKEWIIEDVYPNIDKSQFGDKKGTGTEHLLVYFVDKVLSLLDSTNGMAAVIAASCDWREAFDRQDPLIIAS